MDSAAAPTALDLDEALERIIHRWVPTAQRQWRVDSQIGSAAVNLDRLQTALDSLLENAVKFTVTQDVIELRGWRNNTEFFIEVRDTGRGIPPEELPYVFGHFATGRSAGEQAGTGLGLPIVRAAIEARGGTVTARSSPSEGTTFLIAIPDQVPDRPTPTTLVDIVPEALQVGRRSTPRPLSPA